MSQAHYQSRINKVIDYIDQHLAEQLDLDTLAEVASFSRFHFHRYYAKKAQRPERNTNG